MRGESNLEGGICLSYLEQCWDLEVESRVKMEGGKESEGGRRIVLAN